MRALNRQRGHLQPLRFARFVHKACQESQLRRAVGGIGPDTRRREGIELFEDVGFLPIFAAEAAKICKKRGLAPSAVPVPFLSSVVK